MAVRGVRGAIQVEDDRMEAILAATKELLVALMEANPTLQVEDIASVFFSVTQDLRSAFPAQAAREMGWTHVPMMCMCEIPVQDSLPRCIRVMLHWNTNLPQHEIHHVYLGGASALRTDLTPKAT